MGNELERRAVPSIEHLWRYATAYSGSSLFPDIESAEQAFVKISAGAELGLQPFQAMNGIDVIKGRPVVKPALLAGMLDSSPDFSYTVEWEGETACTISIFRRGKLQGESRFSMEDAERAGLLKPSRNGTPSNYLVYPRNMLWSRAMSNAVRWYAPGLTMGPVYVEGEIVPDEAPPARVQEPVAFSNQTSDLVDKAREMLDATEQVYDADEDLPFEVAAPADPHAAESQVAPGQIAAEPAAGTGGGLHIDSVDAAARFIRALTEPQKKALKALVGITGTTTNTALAARLYDQRPDWYAEDILRELE